MAEKNVHSFYGKYELNGQDNDPRGSPMSAMSHHEVGTAYAHTVEP